jgi:hypothetical protein
MLSKLLIAWIGAACLAAPAQQDGTQGWTWGAERLQRLERALFSVGGGRGGAAVLSAFGPEALPGYFEVLLLDRLPPGPGGTGRALDGPARAILFQAVEANGREAVVEFLTRLAAIVQPAPQRTLALEFLDRVDTWKDLPLAFRLAADSECPYSGPPAKLTEIIDGLLAADPARCLQLETAIRASDPACQESTLLAIAAHPCPQIGELLSRLLGSDPLLDPALLTRLGEFWRTHPAWIDQATLEPVRRLAASGRGAVQREALLALGQARDEQAVPMLLAAVEAPDQNLAASAHRGLEALSGLRVRTHRGLWRRHVERGQRWEQERGADARAALIDGDAGELARVLREIGEQRLARDRWADAVVGVFERGDPQLSTLALAALAALGSPRAIPSLLDLIEDPDSEGRLRDLASQALCQITGLGMPPDAEGWRHQLEQP